MCSWNNNSQIYNNKNFQKTFWKYFLFHLKEIVLKNIIKQTGFVFFFGLLTRRLFVCNISDNKKIVSSESDKVTTIVGSGSLGSEDGTVPTSRNYFLSILIIIIIILVSGGCEVKVVVLDPAAEKVKIIREFEPTAEDITQDLMTNYQHDMETQRSLISGTRWTEEFKNWISKGEWISHEEEINSRSEGYNSIESGMIREGCESTKFVRYMLGRDQLHRSDTISTIRYLIPWNKYSDNCYHQLNLGSNGWGKGGAYDWGFADESTKMKQFHNIAKKFGLIYGSNYAVIHGLRSRIIILGLYKCSE